MTTNIILYYIYKTVNIVNNKYYIGAHQSSNIEKDPYNGSGKLFKKAKKEFGKKNFIREILYVFDNVTDMYRKEAEIVTKEFIASDNNYNVKVGGGSSKKAKKHQKTYINLGIDIQTIFEMHKTMTYEEIADEIGVYHKTVYKWIKQYKEENNIVYDKSDLEKIQEIEFCPICGKEKNKGKVTCSKECANANNEGEKSGVWKDIKYSLEELYSMAHIYNFTQLGKLTGLSTNGVKNRIIKYAERNNLPPIEYDKTGRAQNLKKLNFTNEEIYEMSKTMTFVKLGEIVGLTGTNVRIRVKKYCLENNLPVTNSKTIAYN